MDRDELKEIQNKNLPRLQWQDVFEAKGEVTEEEEKALSEHFSKFVKSEGCPNCSAGVGHVTWGLAHGEAYCTTNDCGWPYRGAHYDVGPIKSLRLMLPYHPDALSFD